MFYLPFRCVECFVHTICILYLNRMHFVIAYHSTVLFHAGVEKFINEVPHGLLQ